MMLKPEILSHENEAIQLPVFIHNIEACLFADIIPHFLHTQMEIKSWLSLATPICRKSRYVNFLQFQNIVYHMFHLCWDQYEKHQSWNEIIYLLLSKMINNDCSWALSFYLSFYSCFKTMVMLDMHWSFPYKFSMTSIEIIFWLNIA